LEISQWRSNSFDRHWLEAQAPENEKAGATTLAFAEVSISLTAYSTGFWCTHTAA
jgi:hypothetical protein